MNPNTGNMAAPVRNIKLYLLAASLSLLFCIGIAMFQFWNHAWQALTATPQATAETEKALTEAHGDEASRVIEDFQVKWDSLETLRNPSSRTRLATTPFVNDYLRPSGSPGLCNSPSCLVVKSVSVTKVEVLEYSTERFKAIGCAVASMDRVTPDGAFIDSLPPYNFRHIYVFVRDENVWKLAGLFDITNPDDALRDWDYAPEWLRQIIGQLPKEMLYDCEEHSPN